jgi:hypothetical protein
MKRMFYILFLLITPNFGFGNGGMDGVYRGKHYEEIDNSERVIDKTNLTVTGLTLWDSSLKDAQEKIGVTQAEERGGAPSDRNSDLLSRAKQHPCIDVARRRRSCPKNPDCNYFSGSKY